VTRLREIVSLAHLVTESNIKSYVLPVTFFAVCAVASGGVTTNTNPTWQQIGWAFPHALLYMWLYVFYFDLSNQKDPESIKEDKLNKPWRAIPSGRMTIEQAERWYIISTVLLVGASGLWLGGFPEAIAFMVETYIHDFRSGNSLWWTKNLINTMFYSTGHLGASRVAAEMIADSTLTSVGYKWVGMLAMCTFLTIQIQDLRDQEGDRLRGRSTMPLSFGDQPTRWITALSIWFWSVAFPLYWGNKALTAGYILPVLIGGYVGIRVLAMKSVKADRLSFHLHTLLWLPSLYAIPLLSRWVFVSFV
jgi:4-hydroxybenzoate polyprenyltransferase